MHLFVYFENRPYKLTQADKDAELAARWKHCALTSEDLKRPVVSCELGRCEPENRMLIFTELSFIE